jgi:CubicO group peptidase (beta-lactamase class C family)
VDARTCFDLASLTKVLATTPLVLLSIQRGRLALEEPVHRALEGYGGQRRETITVRMLLDHSSGLPAWRRYYEEVGSAGGGKSLATVEGQEAVRRMVAPKYRRWSPAAGRSTATWASSFWTDPGARQRTAQRSLFSEWLAGPLRLGPVLRGPRSP